MPAWLKPFGLQRFWPNRNSLQDPHYSPSFPKVPGFDGCRHGATHTRQAPTPLGEHLRRVRRCDLFDAVLELRGLPSPQASCCPGRGRAGALEIARCARTRSSCVRQGPAGVVAGHRQRALQRTGGSPQATSGRPVHMAGWPNVTAAAEPVVGEVRFLPSIHGGGRWTTSLSRKRTSVPARTTGSGTRNGYRASALQRLPCGRA